MSNEEKSIINSLMTKGRSDYSTAVYIVKRLRTDRYPTGLTFWQQIALGWL